MKDLGTINEWANNDARYELLKNCKHGQITTNLGRCYNQITCEVCKFTYKVDSSDR